MLSIYFGYIAFFLGINIYALHAIIKDPKQLLYIFGITTLMFLFSLEEGVGGALMASVFYYTLFLVFFYKKELIPVVNEKIIFLGTMVFGYVFYLSRYAFYVTDQHVTTMEAFSMNIYWLFQPFVVKIFNPLMITMGIILFIIIIFKFKIPTALKALLFAWYMCIVFVIGLLNFGGGQFGLLFKDYTLISDLPQLIILGLFFGYVMTTLTPVFMLIPGKRQSMKSIKRNWKFVSSRVSDEQFGLNDVAIVVAVSLILLLNAHTEFISPIWIADIFIFTVPFIAGDRPYDKRAAKGST